MTKNKTTLRTLGFTKENKIWYADLPEFIEQGLGTKDNLMMVAGADTLLDTLSGNTNKVSVIMSKVKFDGFTDTLVKTRDGLDKKYLDAIGHAPVDYGAYYKALERNHDLWLCPVTEYVFDGGYPDNIYLQILQAN